MQSTTFTSSSSENATGAEGHWTEVAQPSSRESFCTSWLALQCGLIGPASAGIVLLGKPDAGPYTPAAIWPDPRHDLNKLTPAAEQALRERRGILLRADNSASSHVAYPLEIAGRIHGVVVLDVATTGEEQLRQVLTTLHWGAGRLELFLAQEESARSTEIINRLAMNLDLVAVVGEHHGFIPAARAFVTELASRLGCDRVSVGFYRQNHIEVTAISHNATFKHRSNLVRAIGAAMDEAYDQEAVVLFPEPASTTQPRITTHAADLVQHNGGGAVCTLPLFDDAEPVGALVLESAAENRFDASTVEFCKTIAALSGPVLSLHRREAEGIASRIFTRGRSWLDRLTGPRHFGLKAGAAIGVLLLVLAIFATGEYRITADATLEGRTLRAAVSPFDGYIDTSSVRPGDIVQAGQVLCELDSKDLAVERQKWLSRRQQYARELREAKAKHEWSGVGILVAQNKQAEAELELLEDKLARTRISAHFDGIVVSGDLSQSLGAPVQRGDVLFEIAPLDSYRVVLDVDERDVEELAPGQEGQLSLASMPADDFSFVIEKITPVATAAEGKNFFRVEAMLGKISERLRPGMEGVAKIHIGERRLVWIWTHRIIDWFRLWFWSWWP